MVSKARILVSVLVLVVIGILFIPPEQSNTDTITVTAIDNDDIIDSEDIYIDQAIIDQAIQEYSIIETNRVFTESNDSLITQFLDDQEIDTPLSTEKFGIETQVALFDSDNNVPQVSKNFTLYNDIKSRNRCVS